MASKRRTPEEIVQKVRQVVGLVGQGVQREDAIRVKRKLNSTDVIDVLTDLFILRGPPAPETIVPMETRPIKHQHLFPTSRIWLSRSTLLPFLCPQPFHETSIGRLPAPERR